MFALLFKVLPHTTVLVGYGDERVPTKDHKLTDKNLLAFIDCWVF